MGGRVLTNNGEGDQIVGGLYAAGEASCASVHGANRLGANSLLDIVVFGRACANRINDIAKPSDTRKTLPKDSWKESVENLDHFRYANGPKSTAELRLKMQK